MDATSLQAGRRNGYHDLWLRIIGALIASHLIVSFGEKENLFQLLLMWDYWRSLLISFAIAFLLVSLVYLITVRLDRRYDWKSQSVSRAFLQITLGLLLPALCAFFLAYFYFAAFGLHILDTPYLRFDFPIIVLMLVMLNLYYLAYYFFRRWQSAEHAVLNQIHSITPATSKTASETFTIQQGAQSIPVPVASIAYFYRDGDYNFLKTFDGNTHLVSQTLDEIENSLERKMFFRANRQVIINKKACKSYATLEYGKLQLNLEPIPKEMVIISQRKSRLFKEWINH